MHIEAVLFSKVHRNLYTQKHTEYFQKRKSAHNIDIQHLQRKHYLLTVEQQFYRCMRQDRANACPEYPTTRFHNIEYRRVMVPKRLDYLSIYNMQKTISEMPQHLPQVVAYKNNLIRVGGFMPLYKCLMNGDLAGIINFFDDVYSVFYGGNPTKYHSDNFTVKDMQKLLYDLPHKQLLALPIDIREKVISFLTTELLEEETEHMATLSHNKNYVDTIIAGMVDIYALPRIIKNVYNYTDSNIITAYAGDGHINRYAKFLETILGGVVISNTNVFTSTNPPLTPGCVVLTEHIKWDRIMNGLHTHLYTGSGCKLKPFIM